MDSNPVHHPSPAKKWNAHFWIMFNFWWSAWLVDGLEPHLPPLSSEKNKMLIFGLCSTSDDQPGWSMDSNPVCHPSPAKKIKYSFLDYVQFLMISWAGQWTQTLSATPLQPKNKMLHFWITFNFWWSAGLVDVLKPCLPPLSSQKIKMLIFGLHSTSDDQPGWSMDSNPVCHPSPAKKIKCLFLDYIQLLMIGRAGRWITFNFWWTGLVIDLNPCPPLSSQKNKMLIFGLRSTSDDQPAWSMDSNPSATRSPAKKIKCLFLDYIQFLMIGWAGQWTWTPRTSLPKNKMPRSTSDDRPGRWTRTPATPLKWNACFWITFNFWWSAGLVDGLKPPLPPLSSQ